MITSNIANNNSTLTINGVATTGVMNYLGNPQAITTNGQYCPIYVGFGNTSSNPPNLIYTASYEITTGAGVTAGAVALQLLIPPITVSGGVVTATWVTATSPNSATGAAFTLIGTLAANSQYNGTLMISGANFTPCFGLRFNVTALAGGNITYAHLMGTMQ